jgi:hypothetical protein
MRPEAKGSAVELQKKRSVETVRMMTGRDGEDEGYPVTFSR